MLIKPMNTILSLDLSSPSSIAIYLPFKFILLFPTIKCWVFQSLYFFLDDLPRVSALPCLVLNYSFLQTVGPLHLFCFLCLKCSPLFVCFLFLFCVFFFVFCQVDICSSFRPKLTYYVSASSDLVQSDTGSHNTR